MELDYKMSVQANVTKVGLHAILTKATWVIQKVIIGKNSDIHQLLQLDRSVYSWPSKIVDKKQK